MLRSTALPEYEVTVRKISSSKCTRRPSVVLRLVMPPSYVGRRAREHPATDSVRSKLPPLYVPVSSVARLAWRKPCRWTKTSSDDWSPYVGRKGEQIRRYKEKKAGKFDGNFRRPPLAEFGADAARSFDDRTTGVGGTGKRSRRCRWCSGCSRSSAGYTETGMAGKIHLDTITTQQL